MPAAPVIQRGQALFIFIGGKACVGRKPNLVGNTRPGNKSNENSENPRVKLIDSDVLGTEASNYNFANTNIVTNNNYSESSKKNTVYKAINEYYSDFTFTKTTKTDLSDENFYNFKTKVESAGNLLSLIARASKQLDNQVGSNTIFQVEFSQYIKNEIEFIKHWDLNRKKIVAFRSFIGIAIPYGNSNSIPFSRSYFAGGSNDNRAWQSYSLGHV